MHYYYNYLFMLIIILNTEYLFDNYYSLIYINFRNCSIGYDKFRYHRLKLI